jgi:hypothetical protein
VVRRKGPGGVRELSFKLFELPIACKGEVLTLTKQARCSNTLWYRLDFIPQLISDYEIKRPKPSVVESRELGAHEAYNDLRSRHPDFLGDPSNVFDE